MQPDTPDAIYPMSIGAFIESVTPATDRTPLDLDAIRARAHQEIDHICDGSRAAITTDVERLLAEVTALRVDNAALSEGWDDVHNQIAALRAELDATRAKRTELATGEDVAEILAEAIHTAFRKASGHPNARTAHIAIEHLPEQDWAAIVSFVAAALDLPGREQALREAYITSVHNVNQAWRDRFDRLTAERDDDRRVIEHAIYGVAGKWILHDDVRELTDAILAALKNATPRSALDD